jgi:hypothetical protein
MTTYQPWPPFSAEHFKPSSHLLYMCVQIMGKLMLTQPFTPHWANLAMPMTSRGFTTGPIPYNAGTFSVDMDCIDHTLLFTCSWEKTATLKLEAMSVAQLALQISDALQSLDVTLHINQKPQETSHTTPFDKDHDPRAYDKAIINAWWRILVSTTRVLNQFHAKFYGITPMVGLCWGTLDLRDARYKGTFLPTKNMGYISRNAMDDEQFEVGFSANNEKYPVPSFFAFAFPKPQGYEQTKLNINSSKWVNPINEFILDYNDLCKAADPGAALLEFYEESYRSFAELANWDPKLTVAGEPV